MFFLRTVWHEKRWIFLQLGTQSIYPATHAVFLPVISREMRPMSTGSLLWGLPVDMTGTLKVTTSSWLKDGMIHQHLYFPPFSVLFYCCSVDPNSKSSFFDKYTQLNQSRCGSVATRAKPTYKWVTWWVPQPPQVSLQTNKIFSHNKILNQALPPSASTKRYLEQASANHRHNQPTPPK